MNLHRTGNQGQWVDVPEDERNAYQRLAARTRGIITPANVVSVVGAGIVLLGVRDVKRGKHLRGVIKIGVGRLFDNADGAIAEATGTKSPIGEAIDAIADKYLIFKAAQPLVDEGLLPERQARVLKRINKSSMGHSVVAKARRVEIHPSEEGKLFTGGQWGVVGLNVLSAIASESGAPRTARTLEIASQLSFIATRELGEQALVGYNLDALAPKPEPEPVPAPAQ